MKQYDMSQTVRCYNSHPPLLLKDGVVIYGGSCSTPVVKDADVYIGFDHSMRFTERNFPWMDGTEIFFPIVDGSVPQSIAHFKKLIEFTIVQLNAGKKVHVGCIGGHGRTGLFLAALVKEYMGTVDAVTYVRTNYCKKAVETQSQMDWLNKHFGITPVTGSRAALGTVKNSDFFLGSATPETGYKAAATKSVATTAKSVETLTVMALKVTKANLWVKP